MRTLLERLEGGLLGLLIGDALGVPYEFHAPEALPRNAPIRALLDHFVHALFAPRGNPLDAVDFFQRFGYERNPVASRNNTVAKLFAITDARMDANSNLPGAKELAAAF